MNPFRLWGRALPIALALELWSSRVPAASLSWQAAEGCASEKMVREDVERQRGEPLDSARAIDFTAKVLRSPSGTFELLVRLTENPGVELPAPAQSGESWDRRIVSQTCAPLQEALVSMILLALGPRDSAPESIEDGDPAQPEKRSGERKSLVRAASTEDPSEAPSLPDSGTSRLRGGLAAAGALDFSSFGSVSAGVFAEGILVPSPALDLRGALGAFRSRLAHPADSVASGQFTLFFAAALVCANSVTTPVRASACVGMEVGTLSASGEGVATTRERSVPWVAARAEARASVPVSEAVSVWLFGGVVAPLLRHEFVLLEAELHKLPAIAPRAGLGLELVL